MPTPNGEQIVDFSNLKIETPYTALKPTLGLLFQYISAQQIELVSVCGSVAHTDRNYMTLSGTSSASKVKKVIDLLVK